MKRNIFVIFLYVFLCFSCKNMNDVKQDTYSIIATCVNKYVSKWNYKPALEVAVYGKERTLNYHYRGGYFSIANNLRVNEDSLFILYSITKSMTASAVIDLVNNGELSLCDTVEDFFQDLDSIYINNDATIEELLTHRSGIQDYTENSALIYDNPFSKYDSWNPLVILDYINTPADSRGTFIYSCNVTQMHNLNFKLNKILQDD